MTTRLSFYHGIGERSRFARDVRRTRTFIKNAAARLRSGDSFFGFEFAPGWTFQARRARGMYYVELLDTRALDVTCTYCRLPRLLRLIDTAWQSRDRASFLRRAPRLNWKRKNVRAKIRRDRSKSRNSRDESALAPQAPKPLGHGDHWEAIFGDWAAHLPDFIPWLCVKSDRRAEFVAPWPNRDFRKILRLGRDHPAAELTTLLGRRGKKQHAFLSAYPVLRKSRTWTVRIEKTSDDYGPFEGVIDLALPHGIRLRCFDPRFGENRNRWTCGRDATVSLAGLALRLEPFDAAPIRVTEGPMLDLERGRLREEGKPDEADALDHVDVLTDSLRTLYCADTDHAQLIGRVERIREIPAHDPLSAGWLLDIEAIPDEGQPAAERVLPVYVFAPALGPFRPQPGELVQGTVWLQAEPA